MSNFPLTFDFVAQLYQRVEEFADDQEAHGSCDDSPHEAHIEDTDPIILKFIGEVRRAHVAIGVMGQKSRVVFEDCQEEVDEGA